MRLSLLHAHTPCTLKRMLYSHMCLFFPITCYSLLCFKVQFLWARLKVTNTHWNTLMLQLIGDNPCVVFHQQLPRVNSSMPYVGYSSSGSPCEQNEPLLAHAQTSTHKYVFIYIYMPGACNYLCACEWLVAVSSQWMEDITPSRSGWHLSAATGCLTVQKIKARKLIKTHLQCVATECSKFTDKTDYRSAPRE